MVCQRALLFERLEVAEAMRNFISHHMSGSEELCAKLERVESDLAAAQKAAAEEAKALKLAEGEKEAIHAEADKLREERRTTKAKFKEAKGENSQLKKEMEKLLAGFAAQKKELEMEYQKQVDEMYLFGYRCCMKKNDITQDIPSLPSNDEGETPNGSS